MSLNTSTSQWFPHLHQKSFLLNSRLGYTIIPWYIHWNERPIQLTISYTEICVFYWDWTQGLTHAKQMLYPWTTAPPPPRLFVPNLLWISPPHSVVTLSFPLTRPKILTHFDSFLPLISCIQSTKTPFGLYPSKYFSVHDYFSSHALLLGSHFPPPLTEPFCFWKKPSLRVFVCAISFVYSAILPDYSFTWSFKCHFFLGASPDHPVYFSCHQPAHCIGVLNLSSTILESKRFQDRSFICPVHYVILT